MTCIQCDKSFEAKRKTARFCSALCKLQFNRGKVSVSPEIVSVSVSVSKPVSVSEEIDPRTDPRKTFLSEKTLKTLSEEDREQYERYLNEDFAFTPNWIARL